jgi:urocanate hydratase
VLLANSNLVPAWGTWDHFRELERRGLMMFGQMTAGSWIYIGSQGIVQGTYETFNAAAARHFGGEVSGRLAVSAGLGGMGGAQPLAAVMTGATFLAAEVDPARIQAPEDRYPTSRSPTSTRRSTAPRLKKQKKAVSVGWPGNAADLLERLLARGVVPDLLTDQTSAHDLLNGYVPRGLPLAEAVALRARDPKEYQRRASVTVRDRCAAMLR